MENKSICIIGFGEVGSTVASMLNGILHRSLFNIIDSSKEISGRFLDFSHACSVRRNDAIFNAFELIGDSDIIVYCAGYSNAKGESRLTVAQKNKQLAQELFAGLRLKPQTLAIVVTNPVELVSKWIYEALGHANFVVGTGTSLDSFRLDSIISEREALKNEEISTMVLGEHGQHMTIIPSQSFVHGKSLMHYYKADEIDRIYKDLLDSANSIRSTEKATKYGVATCVMSIVQAFFQDRKIKLNLSVKVNKYYSELLSVEENIYLSLPCEVGNEEIHILETPFTIEEIDALRLAAKHLQQQSY